MPQLSVIVPTFNETDNVVELRNRVAIALEGVDSAFAVAALVAHVSL